MGGHGPVLWGISLGVADHHGGMVMNEDLAYIQSLRDRAIGFEMQAFYDDRLKQMRDARFRSSIGTDILISCHPNSDHD